MISNIIVFSSLFLGTAFTWLYLRKPGFRARIEQPKYTFLQQLAMYDKGVGSGPTTVQSHQGLASNSDSVNDSDNSDKVSISQKTT